MFDFFASMRIMLAREFANVALGAIAQQIIQDTYLPQLRKDIERAGDDRERERLEEKLEEWTRYSDPRKHEAGIWNQSAAKIVRGEVKGHRRGENDVDEVAGEVGLAFLQNPKMVETTFNKIDPATKSVKDAVRVWNRAVALRSKWVLRGWADEERKMQRGDEDTDPLRNLPSAESQTEQEVELDERTYKALERDLVRFMDKALRDETSKLLFKTWHQVARRKGPDKVVLKKDVYPVLWDKHGVTVKEGRLSELWRNITRILVRFWETPVEDGGAGVRVPSRLKQRLRVSVAGRIAEDVWRRGLCAWMLDGVPTQLRRGV